MLRGAAETIRHYRPQMLVELHENVFSEESRAAGLRLLDALGLRPVPLPGVWRRSETFVTLEPRD